MSGKSKIKKQSPFLINLHPIHSKTSTTFLPSLHILPTYTNTISNTINIRTPTTSCSSTEHETDESEYEYDSDSSQTEPIKYTESDLLPIKFMDEFHQRFQLGDKLGSGGDGDIYSDKLKIWPAIKRIDLTTSMHPQYDIKRAQQEQKLLSTAKIGNIYGIYVDDVDNKLYKIYDRFDYTLDDIMDIIHFGMTEIQTKRMIYDVCNDINKLHKEGFIHCDLNPSNILYSLRGTFMFEYCDKQRFKVIDYDMTVWNEHNDVICIPWRGTLPFCAPEMSDYADDMNYIGYGVDVWCIGLLIVYCINGGDIGFMDIDDDEFAAYYSDYNDEKEAEEKKTEIFDSWYESVFGTECGYIQETEHLYRNGMISECLYDLLCNAIFIRNPQERMNIEGVLMHRWFDGIKQDEYIKNVNVVFDDKEIEIDLYEGIMCHDVDIRQQVIDELVIDECSDEHDDDDDIEEEDNQIMMFSEDSVNNGVFT